MDFAKAFDKCDINILLHKAKALGIKGNLLRWIANFLKERKQKVVVENTASETTEITSGIAQGTVLGALLFLIYIADLGENIEFKKEKIC